MYYYFTIIIQRRMVMIIRYTLALGLCVLCSSCYNETKEETKEETKKDDTMKLSYVTKNSGLQYRILHEADPSAAYPKKGQMISAHYTGWLKDANGERGKKFDSSYDRGKPLNFSVGIGQVIKGWDEALLDMKVNEKRELIIPSELAYGSHGAGNVIPPNATLIFEVELVSINS